MTLEFTQFSLDQLESAAENLENQSDLTNCSVLKYVCTETAQSIRKNIRKRKRRIDEIRNNAQNKEWSNLCR